MTVYLVFDPEDMVPHGWIDSHMVPHEQIEVWATEAGARARASLLGGTWTYDAREVFVSSLD